MPSVHLVSLQAAFDDPLLGNFGFDLLDRPGAADADFHLMFLETANNPAAAHRNTGAESFGVALQYSKGPDAAGKTEARSESKATESSDAITSWRANMSSPLFAVSDCGRRTLMPP